MRYTEEQRRNLSDKMKAIWTPERKAKHAAAIRKWAPWEESTGPTSEQGKAASSQNSVKHGLTSAEFKSLVSANYKLRKLIIERQK